MAICEKHGEYEALRRDVCPGLQVILGCPKCAEEYDITSKQAVHRAWNESMNIEPAFFEANLENFNIDTSELESNLGKVRQLVEGKVKKIIMVGKNGTGKTHLACGALHALGGRILTMYEIATTIRASYTSIAEKSELTIVDELARLPLLVIDELGRTKGSESEQNWLSYIIDKRHVRGLPLILISNKHTRKTCTANGCVDCLENYIGDDIMSRLTQNGVLLKFSGEDYRKRKTIKED